MSMQPSNVERIVDVDSIPAEEMDALTAASQLYLGLPRDVEVDAVAVVGGLGEEVRYQEAVERWNNSDARHLFVAAANSGERTYREPTIETLAGYYDELRDPGNVRILSAARNTPHQASWITEQVVQHETTSVGLVVTEFHIVRAACTLVKTMQKSGQRIPVLPLPIEGSLDMIVPETGEPARKLVPGEAKRMMDYAKKGDVLSVSELTDYAGWVRTQLSR